VDEIGFSPFLTAVSLLPFFEEGFTGLFEEPPRSRGLEPSPSLFFLRRPAINCPSESFGHPHLVSLLFALVRERPFLLDRITDLRSHFPLSARFFSSLFLKEIPRGDRDVGRALEREVERKTSFLEIASLGVFSSLLSESSSLLFFPSRNRSSQFRNSDRLDSFLLDFKEKAVLLPLSVDTTLVPSYSHFF